MIPTVFGVIVITFILFNMVGGSPAMMTLGKNVSPKALEEFDEQRGFNKPLFFGNWTATRAFSDAFFAHNAAFWSGNPYVAWDKKTKCAILPPGTNFSLPLNFALRKNTKYRWEISCLAPENGASFKIGGLRAEGNFASKTWPLRANAKWQTCVFEFSAGENPSALKFDLRSEKAPLKIGAIRLRRGTAHFFDSQFVFYLCKLARLDFGKSTYSNQRVSRMLRDGILPSLFLAVPIFFAGLFISVCISLVCAFFRDTWLDRTFVVVAVILMSVNYLVWIIAGQYLFAFRLGWFPIWGFESWRYLLLPVLIGVISGLGDSLRFYRTIMLDEMYRDYVRTAFAKGVGRGGVLFRHVLKNAMIPILTNVIIAIPFLYTGNLLLEGFFGIPGLGNMVINAINYSDVDVVRAVVFIGAMLYVVANLITDLCYALVDPRVRLG